MREVRLKPTGVARSEAPAPHPAQPRAVALDPSSREDYLNRLRRIEGQIRGLQGMVQEERRCGEVLSQIASVHEALRGVARELMRRHLKHCAAQATLSGPKEADAMYDELIDLLHKYSR